MVRPGTLRALPVWCGFDGVFERNPTQKVTVGCLIAVAAVSAAEAQEQPLPPVTVDAPIARPKPAAAKPSPEQIRARNALRRIAREKSAAAARAKLEAEAAAKKQAAQQDPYADPAAPYKADRLASPKFSEPIGNTPKSITVLTREVLDDKDATSLKDVARTTAGVTIGTGEGGNAFGDRFFIRGFDARNDVFVDGIRDPAVNIRENFFTEQIEILKGPSSTIDGRGTTGGALNIVTKQATTEASFYNADSKFASDNTKRVTFDVNQVISPTLAIRMDGMWQNANVLGARLYHRRSLGRFGSREMDADQQFQPLGKLHTHQPQRAARLRRSLQHRRRCAGHVAGRSARDLLWIRQSRFSDRAAGYRNLDRRFQGQRLCGGDQQVQRRALGPQLYRHDSRAGRRQQWQLQLARWQLRQSKPGQLDGLPQSAEPLSGHRRTGRPIVRDDQVRYRPGAQHARHRRGNFARNRQH
ncbi:MAG: TonB-dependent receptor plug domain-containing protein [Xanthobacteraceae bacterium]